MNKLQTELKTKLNLDTQKEEQICIIAYNGKVIYTHKAKIINGKVKIL